jgi:hypothetical protein
MATALPPHWPLHIRYLRHSQYHSSVPPEISCLIAGGSNRRDNPALNQPSRRAVTIRTISSLSHPAYGQRGLFAAKKIPPRTWIIDYVGEVHCDDRNSDYDISLYRSQDGVSVGVDASLCGNEARFINDYRGILSHPNAIFAERTVSGELCMSLWSGSAVIRKGEEIVVSYGKSWWRYRAFQDADNPTLSTYPSIG